MDGEEALHLSKMYTNKHGGGTNAGEHIIPTNHIVTLTMKPNIRYVVDGAISTLTLNAPQEYESYDEFYIMFVTSEKGCTVLPPSGWIYLDGSTESFEANMLYEFDVVNGKIVCPKGTVVN